MCVCVCVCLCEYKLHQEPLQIPGSCHGYWGPVYTADMNRQRSSVCVCVCICVWLSYSVEVLARVSQEL